MILDHVDHEARAISDVCAAWSAFTPAKRISVAESTAQGLYLKQPGGVPGFWRPDKTPYMIEPMNLLASRKHEAVVFVGPARTGKCLDLDTRIPTPRGWTTMGKLNPGDVVFAEDGTPTEVLGVSEVKHDRPCYEVVFSDGTTLIADDEHLWGVERFYWKKPQWRYEVLRTSDLMKDFRYGTRQATGKTRCRYRVRVAGALECPERNNLLIDPYLLGVWLGNGSSSQATICSDTDDVPHYEAAIRNAGHTARTVFSDTKAPFTNIDHLSTKPDDPFGTFLWRITSMRLLNDKHIPADYLRASAAQRLALLQGLMDTDGYPGADGRAPVEFSTTNDSLKVGFCELARSLGLKPVARKKQTAWTHNGEKRFGTAWIITFSVPCGMQIFTLPRKASRLQTTDILSSFRQIIDIRPVASRPVKCIQVAAASRLFLAGDGMIPTHNTAGLLLGFMTHAVCSDAGDMLFVQMSREKAREFSMTDVDRAIRYSPDIKAMMSASAHADNTHDKMFKNGMFLRIGWPTVSNVSGSTYRYVAITDLDRIENAENVDGEGPLFGLALKRTQTFMSRGMCLAESSPGMPITDPNFVPTGAHEGPNVTGIIGLYNGGDRRRLYWPCPMCAEWFEPKPDLSLFGLPSDDVLLELVRDADLEAIANEHNRIICPHCHGQIGPRSKHALNLAGRWLREGQSLTRSGEVVGRPRESSVASFWMGGVAAAYQSWRSMILRHLQGLREYATTGSEEKLKNTVNVDQGNAYMSRHLLEAMRNASDPASRREHDLVRFVVPEKARFVAAAVDVQGGLTPRFIVQANAIGPNLEQWPIDRYAITESMRPDPDQEGKFLPIDPARYPEDWDCITEHVVRCTYKTIDPNVELRVLMTAVDSGGEDGVTANAYAWYRRVRAQGFGRRVMLVKGKGVKEMSTIPMLKESWVGNRNPEEKGDIPLYLLNTNVLKDGVSTGLKRPVPGPGYIHIPGWMSQAHLDEFTAEIRNPDGTWTQLRKRNESLDLSVYIRAVCLRLGADRISWSAPPMWAKPIPFNSECMAPEERREMHGTEPIVATQKPIAAIQTPARPQRRVSRSRYVSG